jgi:hypothetical protein
VKDVLIRWGGPALILGGLLWVVTYAVEIAIGVTLGEAAYAQSDPSTSALAWMWPACFMGAVLFLGVGLFGVAAHLRGRAKVWGLVGTFLACLAVGAASVNLVTLSGVLGEPTASDDFGFLGVIGVLGGAIVLGIATLRARVLPRWAGLTLALLPLAFVPAILATIPLESIVPDYVVADLPFPVVGLVLATVGYGIRKDTVASEAGLVERATV